MPFTKREQFIINYFTEREHLLFRIDELRKEERKNNPPTKWSTDFKKVKLGDEPSQAYFEEVQRLLDRFNAFLLVGLELFTEEEYREMDDINNDYKLRKDPDKALKEEVKRRKFFPEGWEDDIDWDELKRKIS